MSDPVKLFPGWPQSTYKATITPSSQVNYGEDAIYSIGYDMDGSAALYLKSSKHPRRKPVPIFKGRTQDLHRLGLQIAEAAMYLMRFDPPKKAGPKPEEPKP